MIYFTNEFWINRELGKIRCPKRRSFLRQMFSGEDGWQKFLILMRQRTGADEFRTGEWDVKIPKYSMAELQSKQYPCIWGCDLMLPPKFSPWGELCEDIIPICPKCLLTINNNNQNQNMENQNAINEVTAVAVKNPSIEHTDHAPQSGVTLDEMVAQWPNLKNRAKLRLGERIVHEARELIKQEVSELEAMIIKLKSDLGEKATAKKEGRKPGRPPKVKNNSANN